MYYPMHALTPTHQILHRNTVFGLHFHSVSLFPACARSHQHIGLNYNLICSGRDGIEHQIIPNEENQSPRVQISRKLVNSDWFRHSSCQGGIWQITASQVDREIGGDMRRADERRREGKKNSEMIEQKVTCNGANLEFGIIVETRQRMKREKGHEEELMGIFRDRSV